MIITKKHLPRRTFLRGALGAMVAMPFLDAMVPALSAQAAKRPFRFGAIYIPNGIYPQLWHPETTGSDFAFKPIMEPLEPYRKQLVTISGMKAPDGNPDMGGIHMGASAAWLNGIGPVTDQAKFVVQSKKSIDQFIADEIAGDTPLRSLEVGTEDMGTSAGACDGYPCVVLQRHLVARRHQPAAGRRQPARDLRAHVRRGRLDAAGAWPTCAASRACSTRWSRKRRGCGGRSAPADNVILDEYLTNIRDVERQLDRMDARAAAVPEGAVAPLGLPDNVDDHLTVTYDLMLLAFQADISRVFTFMVGHEGSGRSYAHIGIPEPHHPVSHHGDTRRGHRQVRQADHLSRRQAGRVHRQAAGDRRRRRHAARSLADLLRQRHGQRQRPRSQQPAGAAARRRQRQAEGQPPHRGGEEGADGQPAAVDGRDGGRRGRHDRPQHGTSQPLRIAGHGGTETRRKLRYILASVAS